MQFCHISPTKHLEKFCGKQTHHLLLAHLVEEDPVYREWYASRKAFYHPDRYPIQTYILDNSAFEMYKQGRPMYPSDKLIDMGHAVKADYIVMSDYPNEPGKRTIEAALDLAPKFRAERFGTFFVPQSEIGDLEDYIATFAWAASSPHVDYIGVSILGVPNAYGVEKDNRLQRFFARWKMMNTLKERGILKLVQQNSKRIHFLGMVDGPNEITLCKDFTIHTWDSSAAVWAGLNGLLFDDSPTGLISGKFEKEVNFNYAADNELLNGWAMRNVEYINSLTKK